jgi:hypothetical protein
MLLTVSMCNGLSAWSAHDVITEAALKDCEWLDKYNDIRVTSPLVLHDSTVNPEFEILYANPIPPDSFPAEGVFFDYFRPCGKFYRFSGAPIGSQTTAKKILTEYSNEPDWYMDTNLPENTVSRFMGGSQGYRHMYYPAWTIKIPNLLFPQGRAPGRARYFFERGRDSIRSGDLYWAFRNFARALHYIEDLGQPFHTIQTIPALVIRDDLVKGTTQSTKNFHYAFESYVANKLVRELAGKEDRDYLGALESGRMLPVKDARTLAVKTAEMSRKNAPSTLSLSIDFFDESFLTAEQRYLDSETYRDLEKSDGVVKAAFDRNVRISLAQTSTGIRTFMEIVRITVEGETKKLEERRSSSR